MICQQHMGLAQAGQLQECPFCLTERQEAYLQLPPPQFHNYQQQILALLQQIKALLEQK